MEVVSLALTDFRCYARVELRLAAGTTVIMGGNGEGKTTLLEAVAWSASGHSFRNTPDAALVRVGAAQAVVRIESEREGRPQLLEAEINAVGRNRLQLNRHRVSRLKALHDFLRVTVFAPDDLELVKGGPGGRRRYLDDLLVAARPRYDAVRSDYDRVLRQRNALLRGGVRDESARTTLAVLDDQLVNVGTELTEGRLGLVHELGPAVDVAYLTVARESPSIAATYEAEWAEGPISAGADVAYGLREGIAANQRRELERGVTLVGPHRDDWRLHLCPLDARLHGSQGEQRTLALALRLAGHAVVAGAVGAPPVLLLDDVFSELDPERSEALVAGLPPGQTVVTTAGGLPGSVQA
ncbi:MAG: DNA replication/repair protein RecF, partial [Acidimicrobiia bacterium]